MLRYPDLRGDSVVFSYAGDLWLAPLDDSEPARRLTSHPGLELYPKFSPDGTRIAFTGQYGGDEQAYVIDVAGGAPRQLTWYPTGGLPPARWGTDHQVYGWTPDGEHVLFRSQRNSASPSCTRPCSATSAPGSATRAAGRKTSTFTTWRRTRRAR